MDLERPVEIETKQLAFSRYTMDDLDRVAAWFTDENMMRYYGGLRTRQQTETWLRDRVLRSWQENGHGYWVIVLKESGETIGHCGLLMQVVDDVDELEVGYFLHKDHWGQGIGTEAAGACYGHAFNALNRDRIISLIHPDNIGSRRVAEKNGLTLERQTVWLGYPTCVYAKTPRK